MKTKKLAAVLIVPVLALLGACGGSPSPEPAKPGPVAATPSRTASSAQPVSAPDEAFRKAPPPPGPPVTFVPPQIHETRLPNGVRILHVERRELPIVAVQMVVDRGAAQAGPGVAAFAASMLLQGTKTRSALALSDELRRLGVTYDAGADYDSVGIGARGLTPKLPELLTIMADMVQNPAFNAEELKREKSRRLTAIAQQNDRPGVLLSNMMASTLYPAKHPYSVPLIGTEQDVGKISAADLASFHAANVRPDRLTVAIAGDVAAERATQEIQRVFGAWMGKARPTKDLAAPAAPAAGAPRIVLIDRPGATQSYVSVARLGVPRLTKDYDAILVANTLLGGQFTSRLNLNLREKHAYTYGARSSFDMRHGPGPFSAGGAIIREKTGPAVKEIMAEIERLQRELVTEDELADAKANLILQLPARFETASDTASTLGSLAVYGLPLDEFATRPARIQKVTREDVKRVAEQYLAPGELRVLVVGDAKVVREQLEALGLGAVEEAAPAGNASGKPAGKPAGGPAGTQPGKPSGNPAGKK